MKKIRNFNDGGEETTEETGNLPEEGTNLPAEGLRIPFLGDDEEEML